MRLPSSHRISRRRFGGGASARLRCEVFRMIRLRSIPRLALFGLTPVLSLGAAMTAQAGTRIERKPFGKAASGDHVELFTLSRPGAPTVAITNLGGYVVSIVAPD